jgi:hypothetical protein
VETVDDLAKYCIQNYCTEILEKCRIQLGACKGAFDISLNEKIISEEKSKSLLSLIIHRPFVWDLKSRLFPDIGSLILNKFS